MKHRITFTQRLLANFKRKLQLEPPVAPYKFPVQIGNPVLRMRADSVQQEEINSKKIQEVLSAMQLILRRSKTAGISAPQVGVPLRIFMTEFTAEYKSKYMPTSNFEPWPLKVFINPEFEVLDSGTITGIEGCVSVLGYTASIPRYKKVKVNGLNEQGQPCSWEVSDFAARVVQHEIDHLNGMLYVDRMHSRTFECCNWEKIQRTQREFSKIP